MDRRVFLKTSAAALTAGFSVDTLLAQAQSSQPEAKIPPGTIERVTPPVLQNVSATAATVFWTVSAPATGWVEYGETEELGRIARGAEHGLLPFDSRVLRVRLHGLSAGTKYFYRVHTRPVGFHGPYDIRAGEAQPGPVYAFTTLSSAAEGASCIVWNDTHQNNATLAKLIELLPQFPSDFLVWNGDIFNDVATEEMLIAETLFPAGREFAATRPLVFTCGNHDVRGACARQLARTIEAPEGRRYYTFRQGPVAFLVLDTGEDKDDSHREYGGLGDFASYRLEQQAWLEEAIAAPEFRAAPFRVLLTHIPLRGREHSEDSRAKWEPLLRRARLDFAVSGHTHRYAYSEPTAEQPWPQLVGGGPRPEAATFIHMQATSTTLTVHMFGLDRRDLGRWPVARRA